VRNTHGGQVNSLLFAGSAGREGSGPGMGPTVAT
jgi:hypothetical protein